MVERKPSAVDRCSIATDTAGGALTATRHHVGEAQQTCSIAPTPFALIVSEKIQCCAHGSSSG